MTTPEVIAAVFAGVSAIIPTYFICKAKFNKEISALCENNGGDVPNRRNPDHIHPEYIMEINHQQCRKYRELTEDRLFDGQDKLEKKMETMRVENRDDFKTVCNKIDALKDNKGKQE